MTACVSAADRFLMCLLPSTATGALGSCTYGQQGQKQLRTANSVSDIAAAVSGAVTIAKIELVAACTGCISNHSKDLKLRTTAEMSKRAMLQMQATGKFFRNG